LDAIKAADPDVELVDAVERRELEINKKL